MVAWLCGLGGAALGLASRAEEADPAFDAGISTSTTWLLLAFVAGASGRRARDSAWLGALTLTCANAAYYLRGLYGPVEKWVLLGLAGGAVFGALGWATRHAPAPWRALAPAVLLAVAALEHLGIRTHVLGPGIP